LVKVRKWESILDLNWAKTAFNPNYHFLPVELHDPKYTTIFQTLCGVRSESLEYDRKKERKRIGHECPRCKLRLREKKRWITHLKTLWKKNLSARERIEGVQT